MPIRIRLALLCSLVVSILAAIGGLVFTSQLQSRLLDSLDGELRSRAAAVAAALRAGAPPASQTGRVSGQVDIFVQVLSGEGAVLAASSSLPARPLLDAADLKHSSGQSFERKLGRGDLHHVRLVAQTTSGPVGTFTVITGSSVEPVDDAVDQATQEIVIGAAVLIPLAGVAAWLLGGAALRPFERMRRQVAAISEHDSAARVNVPRTRDELAALARTMNDLLARLQEALSRERTLVADAAHELRTPLAILRTELELAGRKPRSHDELVQAVAHAGDEVERLGRLADDLLFLAHTDVGVSVLAPSEQPLAPVLRAAASTYRTRAAARDVTIQVDADDGIRADVDGPRLRQAVENLLDNAIRLTPPGSTVEAGAAAQDGMAVISVSDAGPGFSVDFLPHAFERFRRADDARDRATGGSGLGLAIVRAIATAHGGWVDARNRVEGGAVVRLAVPLAVSSGADVSPHT